MRISFYGDSIFEGVQLQDGKYTRHRELIERFEAENDVLIKNRSSFGSTVDKGLARMEADLRRGSLGNYTVIEFGGNDCAYRWDEVAALPDGEHECITPPERFVQLYNELITRAYENGSWPIVATLPPVSSHSYLDFVTRGGLDKAAILHWLGDVEAISRWQEKYSGIAAAIARERGCPILDLRSAFPTDAAEKDIYLCSDGIHPNSAGQQLIFDKASEELVRIVGAPNQRGA